MFTNIREHGWHGMHVFDPDGLTPSFTYSVGFSTTLNAPEFIIFGLSSKLMHSILWEVFRQLKNAQAVEQGQRWHGLLEGFTCVSMHATHEDLFKEYATSAGWYWKETGHEGHPEVCQLIWPGAQQGLFPWEQGCVQDVIDAQPQLWG